MRVPGRAASGGSKEERTVVGTRWIMASSTERTWSTLAPSDAISSISSKVTRSMRLALGTTRGSVV